MVRILWIMTLLWCMAPSVAQSSPPPSPEPASPLVDHGAFIARREIVVAAHPLAAQAGAKILAQGGSAADAGIAVQAVLGLVEPQSSGLGGGAFALYWDNRAQLLHAYDGRETAPAAARSDRFLSADGARWSFSRSVASGLSVGVPGTPMLLSVLHQRHGVLPWASLFDPAITWAESGVEVPPRLGAQIPTHPGLAADPMARQIFFTSDGKPRPAGTIFTNAPLATTLRLLATEGVTPFYHGALAQQIVDAVARGPDPGDLTLADLAGYRVIEREPICAPYREIRLCSMPSPSSGGVSVLQILGMLERFPGRELARFDGPAAHLFVEANRLTFADRNAYIADPAFVPQPLAALIARDYLAERSALMSPEHRLAKVEPGRFKNVEPMPVGVTLEPPSTSHFVVVDQWGNVLSITTTIEAGFGSRRMAGGYILNNELTDFTMVAGRDATKVANRVEPGKRPRSSMAPIIGFDQSGTPALALGSAGGPLIIPNVAQTLIGMIDGDLPPAKAVALRHIASSDTAVFLEPGPDNAISEALRHLGHSVEAFDFSSGLHGVRIAADHLSGGSDPRRDGGAAGR